MARTQKKGPTEAEIRQMQAAAQADSLDQLRRWHKAACVVFDTSRPTHDQVLAVGPAVEEDVSVSLLAQVASEAKKTAALFGGDAVSSLALFEIFLDDVDAAAHFTTAVEEARRLYGEDAAFADMVSVYYFIFGDEDEGDDE